jgi:hypothetical protein
MPSWGAKAKGLVPFQTGVPRGALRRALPVANPVKKSDVSDNAEALARWDDEGGA